MLDGLIAIVMLAVAAMLMWPSGDIRGDG
jgi:hypothetical protein